MKKCIFLFLLFTTSVRAQTIAVDIGHYDKAYGALSAYGNTEYSYNKRLAFGIINELAKSGKNIDIIGETGFPISLLERVQSGKNANFFLSIHHDSVEQKLLTPWQYKGKNYMYNDDVQGFSIFVSSKNAYYNESLFCANLVAQNLLTAGFTANYHHTKEENYKQLIKTELPVYKHDNLVVLKKSTMPAILIEAGVIVNRKEAIIITQTDTIEKFSKAIAKALDKCPMKS